MDTLEWWDNKGRKLTEKVSVDQYNNRVGQILQAGGSFAEPDDGGPFGSGVEGGAMNEILRIRNKLDRGEQLNPGELRAWQLAAARLTQPRVTGNSETGFYSTQMSLPAGFAPGQGAGSQPRSAPVPATGLPTTAAAGNVSVAQVTPGQQKPKAIPQDALKSIISTFDSLDFLDTMDKNIEHSGIIEGPIKKGMAYLGIGSPGVVDFETARKQFKLAAQSMIKGIPSNFDVQILIDTLPDLTRPETVNASRIKTARKMARSLIHNTISYYKAAGYTINPQLENKAQSYGIDINQVTPWDGQGDPLTRGPVTGKTAQQRGVELEKQGIRSLEERIKILISEGY
jgi:hypothetical protein